MDEKVKNGLSYATYYIEELQDLYRDASWKNINNVIKTLHNLNIISDCFECPMSDVNYVEYDCITKINKDLDTYLSSGICSKEEVKLEYVGYAALLLTYWWKRHGNGLINIDDVIYLGNSNYNNFASNVLTYIGISPQSESGAWLKRVIKDASFEFMKTHLKRHTLYDGTMTATGRKLAWEDAASDMFTVCHIVGMKKLGF